ncbi:hypothetical protein DICPUDRAFT_87909 [Dictyostelium purpureum]|uniref:Autophagy-related protein 101 n=1 Tax=Dictyostelium purpureum TaxID=5786 RepID=F0ZL67_DICPU|nr:uncharacterized protein DICPUDRAFT_87909 [Dictyostelium purpureum]EGC35294.1 hypothetical protein DICPUDRAFT_87909 [Dictyostelium purpureum]|eukprot:XP_003288161.1 hypothetical protein DICPUDRAFT_87909 [Dictyostelium purpureum]
MNCNQYILEEINLQYSQLKEVVQCILHSILFQRSLGTVKPRDMTLDCVEFSYVKADDPTSSKNIEDKSEELLSSIIKRKAKTAQLSISFYEKRAKTNFFTTTTENVCWEQWIISFRLVPTMDQKTLFSQLTDSVNKIIENVNQDKNIPPIQASNQMPFPFSIQISGSENPGVADMVWNMFKPPQISK